MDWPKGQELTPGLYPVPVRWYFRSELLGRVPEAPDEVLALAFGERVARKIKSWGHDDDGVHWLATRAGTPFHTDPNYARFTHHLVIRNDGWRIRGMSDEKHPPMLPGSCYCLDTHSPHQVVRDDRLPQHPSRYKVQIAVDRDEPLTRHEAFILLRRFLDHNPADTITAATLTAPRYTPPDRKVNA